MFDDLFGLVAAAAPLVFFVTAPVLLVARFRQRPWPWGRAAAIAAPASALAAGAAIGLVSFIFAGGIEPRSVLLVAAAGAAESLLAVGAVALGARLLERVK